NSRPMPEFAPVINTVSAQATPDAAANANASRLARKEKWYPAIVTPLLFGPRAVLSTQARACVSASWSLLFSRAYAPPRTMRPPLGSTWTPAGAQIPAHQRGAPARAARYYGASS